MPSGTPVLPAPGKPPEPVFCTLGVVVSEADGADERPPLGTALGLCDGDADADADADRDGPPAAGSELGDRKPASAATGSPDGVRYSLIR